MCSSDLFSLLRNKIITKIDAGAYFSVLVAKNQVFACGLVSDSNRTSKPLFAPRLFQIEPKEDQVQIAVEDIAAGEHSFAVHYRKEVYVKEKKT